MHSHDHSSGVDIGSLRTLGLEFDGGENMTTAPELSRLDIHGVDWAGSVTSLRAVGRWMQVHLTTTLCTLTHGKYTVKFIF